MEQLKKGLQNPLEEAQVRRAVVALQTFLEKKKDDQHKKPLVENTEYLSCILTRKVIPAKGSLKPIQIDVPFSLRGGENDAEMCLFVKDGDKERIKAAVAADPVLGLAKIMTVKKLKKNFSRFDDKRTLAGAYDLFLADDRILPYLKEHLGTKFFIKKKQPIAVRVSRKDVSNSVRAVFRRTALHTSTGVCSNVKIAHMGMDVDEIVANILVGMNNCAAHISKGWRGIQSINIKTADSVSLPIYNSLAELAKLPPANKKQLLTKRKLEEVEAATDAPAKKTKKNNGHAAKKETTPAKKEQTHTKATPVKEAPKAVKKAAKKENTPVKEEPKKSAKKEATPAKQEPKKAAKKERTPVKDETTPKAAKKTGKKEATPVKEETTPKAAKKDAKKATPVKKETSTPTKASPAAADKPKKRKSESTPEPSVKSAKKASTPQTQTPPSSTKSKDKKKKKTPTKQ